MNNMDMAIIKTQRELQKKAYQRGINKGLRFMGALVKLWIQKVSGPYKRKN
jgi:hypothetical protein